jgi:predicted transposase/invertase (TIGR01784 family)
MQMSMGKEHVAVGIDVELKNRLYIQYPKLSFTDDFIFWKTLTSNPELCKSILELLMGVKIRKIVYLEGQKYFQESNDGKAIRMDVYVEDDQNSVYDLEMQTTLKSNLPKRMRYYQGICDMELIQQGEDYSVLKRMYIIFICTSDPFRENLPIYTFKSICQENPSLLLNDEVTKLIVNASGDTSNLPEGLKAFVKYLSTSTPTDDLTGQIEGAVAKARLNKRWRDEYMTINMELKQQYKSGLEDGFKDGFADAFEKSLKALVNMSKNFYSNFTEICAAVRSNEGYENVSDEDIRKYL